MVPRVADHLRHPLSYAKESLGNLYVKRMLTQGDGAPASVGGPRISVRRQGSRVLEISDKCPRMDALAARIPSPNRKKTIERATARRLPCRSASLPRSHCSLRSWYSIRVAFAGLLHATILEAWQHLLEMIIADQTAGEVRTRSTHRATTAQTAEVASLRNTVSLGAAEAASPYRSRDPP